MKLPRPKRTTLALFAVISVLLATFVYVALRSGPLAPVAVTTAQVQSRAITPALFGIGTVEARYTYKIGPTAAGRVSRLDVEVGDRVRAGQVLGEMDPVDLDDRVRSQGSAMRRAAAAIRETQARQTQARTQARRYDELYAARLVSEEVAMTRRQEAQIADAVLSAAQQDYARAAADHGASVAQRQNLKLIAPVDGVIALRLVDPGTTVVAGQPVVEIIDPDTLWINARFDQVSASGLVPGLPARIVLRSHDGQALAGSVLRVEPKADAVTEELLAKVRFATLPESLPPIDELAEVTVDLPTLAATPVILNAALRREAGVQGVYQVAAGDLRFVPVKIGASDLDGHVQVLEGLKVGDAVVLYSEKPLTTRSRIRVVDDIAVVPK